VLKLVLVQLEQQVVALLEPLVLGLLVLAQQERQALQVAESLERLVLKCHQSLQGVHPLGLLNQLEHQ
jgi:hypothetical protein